MTMREFYTAILNNETLSTEIRETAQKCIATLDKRNENRSSKPSKKAEENKVLAMDLLPYIDDGESKTCAKGILMKNLQKIYNCSLRNRTSRTKKNLEKKYTEIKKFFDGGNNNYAAI